MRYAVITDNGWDMFLSISSSLEDANRDAEREWDYLTAREQKQTHIYVGAIPENSVYVDPSGDDESISTLEGGFDSDVWYAVVRDEDDDDWGTGSRYMGKAR